jgi:hypothetical protein
MLLRHRNGIILMLKIYIDCMSFLHILLSFQSVLLSQGSVIYGTFNFPSGYLLSTLSILRNSVIIKL